MSKIAISGIGVVSPVGIDANSFYSNLLNSKRNFRVEVEAYKGYGDGCLSSRISDDYKKQIDEVIGDKANELSLATKYAIYCTKMALKDADMSKEYLKDKRVSVIIGSNEAESELFDNYVDGQNVDKYVYSSCNIAEEVAEYFGLRGIQYCIHNTCASANMALEQGISDLKKLNCDIAIVGSSDPFSLKVFTGFSTLRAITKDECKPFSKERNGIVIAEGSGIVVLEKEEDLAKRNKKAYCEVLGVGSSNDASSLVKPDSEGIELAIQKAILNSGIKKEEINYIMAHGTGTRANDSTESLVINKVFKDGYKPKVCAIKGVLGHAMGSGAALSIVAICLIYKNGIIPSSQFSNPLDENCNIDVIRENINDDKFEIWMNDAFGFGGNNSVSIFRRI